MDVRKAIHLFTQVQVPIMGIIENMSYYLPAPGVKPVYLFGNGGGDRLAQEMGVPLLGEVPVEAELCKCGDEGRSLWNGKTNGAVNAFNAIAQRLVIEAEKMKMQASTPRHSQIDPWTIAIHWDGGEEVKLRFSDIQKNCGCAHCVDESSGNRRIDPNTLHEDVSVKAINLVGRYGLQFQFTSGCSTGIYSFDRLRKLAPSN